MSEREVHEKLDADQIEELKAELKQYKENPLLVIHDGKLVCTLDEFVKRHTDELLSVKNQLRIRELQLAETCGELESVKSDLHDARHEAMGG